MIPDRATLVQFVAACEAAAKHCECGCGAVVASNRRFVWGHNTRLRSARKCSVADCGRDYYGKGYCQRHWSRWHKTGTPEIVRRFGMDLFMSKVTVADNGCWLWTGALTSQSYANSSWGLGHRYAYEQLVGPIPAGLTLDHICHSRDESCSGGRACMHRRCVNPEHLEPVTHLTNCQRGRLGEVSGAQQRAKTHCPQGHPYAGTNVRIKRSGSRYCGECYRLRCAPTESEVGGMNRAQAVQLLAACEAMAGELRSSLRADAYAEYEEQGTIPQWRMAGYTVYASVAKPFIEVTQPGAFLEFVRQLYPHQVETITRPFPAWQAMYFAELLPQGDPPCEPDGTIVPGLAYRRGGEFKSISVRPAAGTSQALRTWASEVISGQRPLALPATVEVDG